MKPFTLSKTVSRLLLYFGLAAAILVVFVLVFALSVSLGFTQRVSRAWIGLAFFTIGLFWFLVKAGRDYWRRPTYWMAVAGVLTVHLLAFVAILRNYPRWPLIWFVPTTLIEFPLITGILEVVYKPQKR